MLATKIEQKKNEEGFTLIELLVVVIIIGILAAVAIPVFLNQRENAYRSAVESDLRNAAIAMETLFTRDGDYEEADEEEIVGPASVEIGTVQFTASDNVTLTIDVDGGAFEISGTHSLLDTGEDTLVYDSTDGGLANSNWG